MQLKVWLVHKHLSCLGMQLKHPVYKKLCTLTQVYSQRCSGAIGLIFSTSKSQQIFDGSHILAFCVVQNPLWVLFYQHIALIGKTGKFDARKIGVWRQKLNETKVLVYSQFCGQQTKRGEYP